METIVRPTIAALAKEGAPYRGVLYVGLMMTAEGPTVLEFNCRFGDPECQALLVRAPGDLVPLLVAAAHGGSWPEVGGWPALASVCVALASGGYPGKYRTGVTIDGVEAAEARLGVRVFHAGTALRDGRLVTEGGRVLGVTAVGDDLATAIARAYGAIGEIRFEGMHYRSDIGRRRSACRSPPHRSGGSTRSCQWPRCRRASRWRRSRSASGEPPTPGSSQPRSWRRAIRLSASASTPIAGASPTRWKSALAGSRTRSRDRRRRRESAPHAYRSRGPGDARARRTGQRRRGAEPWRRRRVPDGDLLLPRRGGARPRGQPAYLRAQGETRNQTSAAARGLDRDGRDRRGGERPGAGADDAPLARRPHARPARAAERSGGGHRRDGHGRRAPLAA